MKKKSIALLLALMTVMQFSTPIIRDVFALEIKSSNNDSSQLRGSVNIALNLKVPMKFNEENDLKLILKSDTGQDVKVNLINKQVEIDNNKKTDDATTDSSVKLEIKNTTEDSVKPEINKIDPEVTVKHLNYLFKEVESNDDEYSPYIYNFSVDLENIPVGKYYVQIDGDGFVPIKTKRFEINKYSKRINIGNGSPLSLKVDVNDDEKSDKKDYELIEKNIGTNNLNFDVSKDGLVDIEDLSFAYESINYSITNDEYILDTSAIVDISNIDIRKTEGLEIEGDLANLFNNSEEKITLNLDNLSGKEAQFDISVNDEIKSEQVALDVSGISQGQIVVEDENGEKYVHKIGASRSAEDKITINLGKQVAVKKITIKITDTKNDNLAQIGKVEFLNNLLEEVPEPPSTPPNIHTINTDSEEISIRWDNIADVEGYKVEYYLTESPENKNLVKVRNNIVSLKGLEDLKEYTINVRSYSGSDWQGDVATVTATPAPNKKADPPENVSITGIFNGININWKKMKGATSFNLYYKKNTDSEFTQIDNITSNSYVLQGLEGDTVYDVKLTSVNEYGESDFSKIYSGQSLGYEAPIFTKYKLINTGNESGGVTNHIVDVEYPSGYKEDEYPNGFNKFNTVDNDYSTHWQLGDWDTAIYSKRGPIVTFDNEYKMDTIRFIARLDGDYSRFYKSEILYWKDGEVESVSSSISSKRSSNGKTYYEIKLEEPIVTDKIQVNISTYSVDVTVSELKFYYYDSIENDVRDLFADDMRIELKDDITLEQIEELELRANTIDEISKEYHPQRENLLYDLNTAKSILQDREIADTIVVNQNINNGRNSHLGFAMQLNDYQPLGISARAGEEISVYVGTEGNVMPELVFTQYYPESSAWNTTIKSLKEGKNVIQVPTIGSMATEHGGSVYIRYPRSSATDKEIKVRVSGGTKIPYLNINEDEIRDEVIAKQKIESYINSLESFVSESIPNLYENDTFDPTTSVLNSTEIATKKFLLTLPATEVLKGINSNVSTLEEKVNKVYDALLAWEELGDVSYGVKGLYKNPDRNNDGKIDNDEAKHSMPSSRLNIRYTRMFAGAFMYATGQHIGVEFGSVAPLLNGKPSSKNEDGSITSYDYYGWGIAHEIGHVIDEGNAIYGETTNNIISLVAQTIDDKSLSRIESSGLYPKIYDKVNSGSIGIASNVFVSLGMFWQLHLAYDNEPAINQENSFFAKLNRLYRENNESTSTQEAKDNLFIRLSCDVVQKDLTEFFEKWGFMPNEETLDYIAERGYEKEERAIYYLNDEARRQRLNNVGAMSKDNKVNVDLSYSSNSNEVTLNLSTSSDSDKILGYEIFRNGEAIGFSTDDTYVDTISLNNRVYTYEVVAYDYLLNKTSKTSLDPIKVMHDGTLSKSQWGIDTNTKNENHNECDVIDKEVNKAIDNDVNTYYSAKRNGNEDPYIILDLNSKEQISGIKYTAALESGELVENTVKNYQVYVSIDKTNWNLVSSGNFELDKNNSSTVYFNEVGSTGGKQLWTHEAYYVKLVAPQASGISLAEIGLVGNVGDNIDFSSGDIGILSKEYKYGVNNEDVIPKDSIIFSGKYRGNPIFNALLLKDKNGNVLPGEQIFMAEIPDNGHVGEVSEGTWIYWITPDEINNIGSVPASLKGELYRVNDAETLEGQRLVSDTLFVEVPSRLPNIEFDGGIVLENNLRGISYNNAIKGVNLK